MLVWHWNRRLTNIAMFFKSSLKITLFKYFYCWIEGKHTSDQGYSYHKEFTLTYTGRWQERPVAASQKSWDIKASFFTVITSNLTLTKDHTLSTYHYIFLPPHPLSRFLSLWFSLLLLTPFPNLYVNGDVLDNGRPKAVYSCFRAVHNPKINATSPWFWAWQNKSHVLFC